MKLAICNDIFEGWELRRVFVTARDLGYDVVELAPFAMAESASQITPAQRERIRRDADAAAVEITGLHWLFVSPAGLHLTGPDASVRVRTRDYLAQLVRLCADIGGKALVIGSPNQGSLVEGVTSGEAFEYARQVFRRSAVMAGELGVTLCIEPLASRLTNFINVPSQALELIEAVDHPSFRMILDVCASSAEDAQTSRIIRKLGWSTASISSSACDGTLMKFVRRDASGSMQSVTPSSPAITALRRNTCRAYSNASPDVTPSTRLPWFGDPMTRALPPMSAHRRTSWAR